VVRRVSRAIDHAASAIDAIEIATPETPLR
jgi:hypothetical protein